MAAQLSVGITQLAYKLPTQVLSLRELEAEGGLSSPAELLESFGFECSYVHDGLDTFEDLVIESGRQAVGDYPVSDIGLLLWCSGLMEQSIKSPADQSHLAGFRYPVARAHHELGLSYATAFALSQAGCSGLLAAIDVAAAQLQRSSAPAVLCLAGDALGPGAPREIMYNLMSDAGAAVLLERDASKNRIVGYHTQMQSYYWDTPEREQELLAAYFPMAQRAIFGALAEAGLDISGIRWLVPHNVSLRSWQILARLLGVDEERIWTRNIARVGHTVSCDHIINLVDMEAAGVLQTGDYLLLFTFGFGASWSCLILQH